MKIKDIFILKEIENQTVAIYCQDNTVDFRRAISLNGSAELMFKALLEETSRADLIALLMQSYDISKQQAENDLDMFLKRLGENNLLDG